MIRRPIFLILVARTGIEIRMRHPWHIAAALFLIALMIVLAFVASQYLFVPVIGAAAAAA